MVYSDIPSSIPNGCSKLTINGDLGTLSASSFSHLENNSLTHLNISNSHIDGIDQFALLVFKSLEELDVSYNYIKILHAGTFETMLDLERLFLQRNSIDVIEVGAFRRLTSLKTLRLEHNNLVSIDYHFSYTTNLVTLDLSYNEIRTTSSDAFSSTSYLEELFLGYNSLTEIPRSICRDTLQHLRVLGLESNRINSTGASDQLGLEYLQELYLTNNEIPSIDEFFFEHLDKLEVLHLDSNRLTSFQAWLHRPPPNLRETSLGVNHWNCRCDQAKAWRLLQERVEHRNLALIGREQITCYTPESLREDDLLDFMAACKRSALEPYWFGVIAASALLLVTVALFLIICLVKRRRKNNAQSASAPKRDGELQVQMAKVDVAHLGDNPDVIPDPSHHACHISSENEGGVSAPFNSKESHIYHYAEPPGRVVMRDPSYVNGNVLKIKLKHSRD